MRPTTAVLTLTLALVAACGGEGDTTDTAPPRAQPTTATLVEVETDDVLTSDCSIAPSGDGYVGPTPPGWCLIDAATGCLARA